MPEMPPATLLDALGSYRLLPAIVFLPTRRRCDQAASEAANSSGPSSNNIPKYVATDTGIRSSKAP
jgi:superfamily II RNA helicase